jgi:hypothetical protein
LRPSREEFIAKAIEKGINPELAGNQWNEWDAAEWKDGLGQEIYAPYGKLVRFAQSGWGAFKNGNQPLQKMTDDEYEREKARLAPKDYVNLCQP